MTRCLHQHAPRKGRPHQGAMNDTTRKLATIVALDVAGYSARTEADEAKTVAQISLLRPIIEGIAKSHGGRVFNTAGDGFMLEFASSLSAVGAALELADECRPRVRVGVHVGEVIVQPNGDLLGHGVNVAARLMAKAEPGSAIISADVCRLIRGPLAERFASRGTVQLDKMAETIEIFAPTASAAHTSAPPAKPKPASGGTFEWKWPPPRMMAMVAAPVLLIALALFLWSRSSGTAPSGDTAPAASIAVLPFENLSTDKNNAFFVVGIQDEILTRLAKIGSLKVISRTSTAKFGSRPDNLPEIAKMLGVANILEGSVQRDGNDVRVNVQLINAETDSHLWAEVYDRKLDHVFTVQSEIAVAIAEALSARVTGGEKQTLAQVPTTNTAAYDAYLRGLALTPEGDTLAHYKKVAKQFRQATEFDPGFALAWAALAWHESLVYFNNEQTPVQRETARTALETALRLQPDLAEVQVAKGFYQYYVEGDYQAARTQFESVLAKWPGNAHSIRALALLNRRLGRWDDAKRYIDQAIVRDPLRTDLRWFVAGWFVSKRDPASALTAIDSALSLSPERLDFIASKSRILQGLGRLDEAAIVMKPLLKSRPEDGLYPVIANQALLQRHYGEAIAVLQGMLAQKPDNFSTAELKLMLGHLYKQSGDEKRATEELEQARTLLFAEDARQPNNPNIIMNLAWTYCYLGDREKALTDADKAIAADPNDVAQQLVMEEARMKILAYFGDRDRAIPEIERLLKAVYFEPFTRSDLRLDPIYEKLRSDPRFEALLKNEPAGK